MSEDAESMTREPAAVVELFGPDALLLRHQELQAELGKWSRLVVEANEGYNGCIREILRVAEVLRNAGVDTTELVQRRDAAVPPDAAINGYGAGTH